MKTIPDRFALIIDSFPQLKGVLAQLEAANVPYIVGGSVALYVQGNERKPHDVDIMFVNEAHDAADKLFGITSTFIERPNVTMRKSTPVQDGSIDFLSNYTLIVEGKRYHHPPVQKVPVSFEGRLVHLIPAEKIAAIKLLGRRTHHQDIEDVKALLENPSFDHELFWEMVDLFDAREVVTRLLSTNNLST